MTSVSASLSYLQNDTAKNKLLLMSGMFCFRVWFKSRHTRGAISGHDDQIIHRAECEEYLNSKLDSPLTFLCLTDAFAALMAAFLVFCDIIRPAMYIKLGQTVAPEEVLFTF